MSPYRDDHGFVPDPYSPPPPESVMSRIERLASERYQATRQKPTKARVGTRVSADLERAATAMMRGPVQIPCEARCYVAPNKEWLHFATSVGTLAVTWDPRLAQDAVVIE